MVTLRLPEHMEQRLNHLAASTRRTKTFFIREALERTLSDLEDAYLAETAYEEFKMSGEQAIPLTDVMREYGLEN